MKAYQDEALESFKKHGGKDVVLAELLREHDARLLALEAARPAEPSAAPIATVEQSGKITFADNRDGWKAHCAVALYQCKELARERDEAEAKNAQLKAALEKGQNNCDAAYDDLRAERDEARDVARQLLRIASREAASAELLALADQLDPQP